MELKIGVPELTRALARSQGIVEKKSTMPILSHVLLEARKGGELAVSATDLDVSVSGVHPAEVCLKWAAQRGHVAIPFSVKPTQILSNLRCVTERPLTPEMLYALRAVESNSRLIKGQVFLWEGSDSWLDLWDVDGTIPGWTGYGSTAAE